MNQANRRTTEPYHLKMQRAIDVGLAASVIHRCLKGEEIKPQRLHAALAVYNKTVPTLAAVQIEMQVKQAKDQLSLVSEALAVGIDPRYLFDMSEKKVIEHDVPATPRTPGIDE